MDQGLADVVASSCGMVGSVSLCFATRRREIALGDEEEMNFSIRVAASLMSQTPFLTVRRGFCERTERAQKPERIKKQQQQRKRRLKVRLLLCWWRKNLGL